jgi:hypothetical protein
MSYTSHLRNGTIAITRISASVPEPLHGTLKMYGNGRVNGFNLTKIVHGMPYKVQQLLAGKSSADLKTRTEVDKSGKIILTHLLQKEGLDYESAAKLALAFPDADIFHPVRARNQAYVLEHQYSKESARSNPVAALVTVAKDARSVHLRQSEYMEKLSEFDQTATYYSYTFNYRKSESD